MTDKQKKTYAMIAGGLILAYLLYRWYSNNQTSSGATGAVAPDTASGDYAALAGQEQADVAALQGQNSQLYSQEQSDIAGLTGNVGTLTSTVGGLGDQFDKLTSTEQDLAGAQSTMGGQISALSAGVAQLNRHETVATHRGGPFFNYYKRVTGKAPPRTVQASNFVYQAWKSGVKATALNPHPSSQNQHVAHPNGNHQQQQHVKPQAPKPPPKPAAKPAPKPAARVAPKPPPKPTKPKASGVRR